MQSIKVKCNLAPKFSTITWKPCHIKYCRHIVKSKQTHSTIDLNKVRIKFEFYKQSLNLEKKNKFVIPINDTFPHAICITYILKLKIWACVTASYPLIDVLFIAHDSMHFTTEWNSCIISWSDFSLLLSRNSFVSSSSENCTNLPARSSNTRCVRKLYHC